MAEDFQHLLDLLVAAEHGRQLVLAREQVEIRREVLQERRQLEPLLQTLFSELQVTHACVQTRHEYLRLDAVPAKNRYRDTLRFFENRGKQIGGFNGLAARPAGMVQRQLEDELGCRRDAELASGERRHHVQMLFDCLKNGVRVQFDVPHHFGEHVPLDLRERQKNVFVGEQRMFTTTRLLDRAIDDALSRFAYLAR